MTPDKALREIARSDTVHNPVHPSHFSSDLQQIIDRWGNLPEHIKAAIKALIQSYIK